MNRFLLMCLISQAQANCAATIAAATTLAASAAQQRIMMLHHQFYDLPYRQQTAATIAEQVMHIIYKRVKSPLKRGKWG